MCTAFFGMVACTGLEPYKIDAPEDLAGKIAEYKAEKDAENQVPDDAVEIELSPAVVGAEDNSSAWWTDFSQYFTIPVAKKLVINFVNYGGASNWNNWVLAITTAKARGAEGYAEYAVIRSDNYGWGSAYDGANIAIDMDGTAPDSDDWWATFRDKMNGASVELTIDHASEGAAYVEAVATATDGTIITETFHCPVSFVDDINVFMVADGAHAKLDRAFLTSSEYPILPDANPAGIKVTGFPEHVDVGSSFEDLLKNSTLTANVVYEDGSAAAVPIENVSFSVEETFGTIPGEEVILYTYALSKKGVNAPAVAGYAKVSVLAPMTGIKASAKINVVGTSKFVTLSPTAVSVVGQYAGGAEVPMSAADCTIEFTDNKIVYSAVPGTYANAFTVTYGEGDAAFTTTGDLVIAASTQAPQTETVGATDNTTGFHAASSKRWTVAAGESETVNFTIGGTAAENSWNCPLVFLYSPAGEEYAFVRLDNWGTGTGYTAATFPTSNWNWEAFLSGMVGANVSLTIANDGLGSASVRMEVLYANSELHFQYFDVITVQPGELQFEVSVELCHLLFGEVTPPVVDPDAATVTSIAVTKQPTVTTYYVYDAAVPFKPVDVEITATYSDNSQKVLNNSTLTFSNIPAEAGSKQITVTYNESINTTIDITVVKGTSAFGVPDFSSGWWTVFSEYYTVASGESKTIGMMMYSADDAVFKAPVVVLSNFERGAEGYAEFVAARIDNFGWGTSYDACQKSNNWPLDGNNVPDLVGKMWGTQLTITITNNGDNTAKIRYDLTMRNGSSYYQLYEGIAISGDSIKAFMVPDGCYLVTL